MKLEVISRSPASSRHATPLLFVHGMMHAAWCWERHFLDYFARHGYESHAVSLRGHGNSEGRERIRWTRIAEFADDLAQTVRGLPSPPVLIGHSMGGVVIQKYLEGHSAVTPGGPYRSGFELRTRLVNGNPVSVLRRGFCMPGLEAVRGRLRKGGNWHARVPTLS